MILKIEPKYDVGDLIKLDYQFIDRFKLKRNFKESELLKSFNDKRKRRGLSKINISNDILIVKISDFSNHTMFYDDGRIVKEKINFSTCVLQKEDYKNLFSFNYQSLFEYKLLYRPSYRFMPADMSNFDMILKWLAITRSCPFCNKRVSIYNSDGSLFAACRSDLEDHNLRIKSHNDDFEATLRVENNYELQLKSYLNQEWYFNGEKLCHPRPTTLMAMIERLNNLVNFW